MQKSLKPFVSVIIPTYNQRGGLSQTINSVLSQTYCNYEIIVIDDNNPDSPARKRTEDLMNHYKDNTKIIYLKHERNKNGSAARNTGIRASSGSLIAFLDDDDQWYPEKLKEEVDFLNEHTEYDAVYSYYSSADGRIPRIVPYEGNALVPLLLNKTRMFTSTVMMTKSSVLKIGGFDESFRRHQDYELLVKFFRHGYEIGCIQKPLAIYTPLGGNTPKGYDFVKLKEQYLSTFDDVLNNLDRQEKGLKNKIVAANYALCFYTFIAGKQYRLALEMFWKWFPVSPSGFISQILFLLKGKVYKQKLIR